MSSKNMQIDVKTWLERVKLQDQLLHRLHQVWSCREETPNPSHSQQGEGKWVQKAQDTLPCTQRSSCESCQLHNICTTHKAVQNLGLIHFASNAISGTSDEPKGKKKYTSREFWEGAIWVFFIFWGNLTQCLRNSCLEHMVLKLRPLYKPSV